MARTRRNDGDGGHDLAWRDPATARHRAHEVLRHLDPDDPEPLDGKSMRSRSRTHVPEHPKGRLERTARGRPKVWKAPFWKRRRHRRRARMASVRDQLRADTE